MLPPSKSNFLPHHAQQRKHENRNNNMPSFSKASPSHMTGFFLKNLQHNLLAVNEWCDVGCTVIFQKHKVEVELNGEIILQGWQDAFGLCHSPTTMSHHKYHPWPSLNSTHITQTHSHTTFMTATTPSNWWNFNMPPFSLPPNQHGYKPLHRGTSKGALASHLTKPWNLFKAPNCPLSRAISTKSSKGPGPWQLRMIIPSKNKGT